MENIHPDARIRQLRHDVRQFLLHWPSPSGPAHNAAPIENGRPKPPVPLTIRFLVEPYRMTSSHLSALANLMDFANLARERQARPACGVCSSPASQRLHETVMNPTTNGVLTPSEHLRNVLDLVNFSGSTELRRSVNPFIPIPLPLRESFKPKPILDRRDRLSPQPLSG